MEIKKINLAGYKGNRSSVFAGRPQGEEVRKELKLDKEDLLQNEVEFIIPSDTTSFNPSFYLGLLFDSIKKLGADNFGKKYKFSFESDKKDVIENLQKNLDDGWRNALNSLNKNFGFDAFFNS